MPRSCTGGDAVERDAGRARCDAPHVCADHCGADIVMAEQPGRLECRPWLTGWRQGRKTVHMYSIQRGRLGSKSTGWPMVAGRGWPAGTPDPWTPGIRVGTRLPEKTDASKYRLCEPMAPSELQTKRLERTLASFMQKRRPPILIGSELNGAIFEPLRDTELFRHARLDAELHTGGLYT